MIRIRNSQLHVRMGWSLSYVPKCIIPIPKKGCFLNAIVHSLEAIVFIWTHSKVATLLSDRALQLFV